MQPSQLFRRGVVLPLTPLALECLEEGNVLDHTAYRYLAIGSDAEFALLWREVLQEIASATGVLIQDYEETEVSAEQLPSLLEALRSASERTTNRAVASFCSNLKSLADAALAMQMPLTFVL